MELLCLSGVALCDCFRSAARILLTIDDDPGNQSTARKTLLAAAAALSERARGRDGPRRRY